jgi:hypothetical protein
MTPTGPYRVYWKEGDTRKEVDLADQPNAEALFGDLQRQGLLPMMEFPDGGRFVVSCQPREEYNRTGEEDAWNRAWRLWHLLRKALT